MFSSLSHCNHSFLFYAEWSKTLLGHWLPYPICVKVQRVVHSFMGLWPSMLYWTVSWVTVACLLLCTICVSLLCPISSMTCFRPLGLWTIFDTHGKLLSVKNPAALQFLTHSNRCAWHLLPYPVKIHPLNGTHTQSMSQLSWGLKIILQPVSSTSSTLTEVDINKGS